MTLSPRKLIARAWHRYVTFAVIGWTGFLTYYLWPVYRWTGKGLWSVARPHAATLWAWMTQVAQPIHDLTHDSPMRPDRVVGYWLIALAIGGAVLALAYWQISKRLPWKD